MMQKHKRANNSMVSYITYLSGLTRYITGTMTKKEALVYMKHAKE